MSRCVCVAAVLMMLSALGGCRCCGCLEHYADVIDDFGDTDVLWDQWYHPRLDVSRAGKPDWCGPVNQQLCPCRCSMGTWKRHDDCWLYPPSHPYWYPGNAFVEQPTAPAVPPAVEPDVPPSELVPPPPVPTNQGLAPAPLPDVTPAPRQLPSTPPNPQQGWRSRQTEAR
jgi:hypothetical protein